MIGISVLAFQNVKTRFLSFVMINVGSNNYQLSSFKWCRARWEINNHSSIIKTERIRSLRHHRRTWIHDFDEFKFELGWISTTRSAWGLMIIANLSFLSGSTAQSIPTAQSSYPSNLLQSVVHVYFGLNQPINIQPSASAEIDIDLNFGFQSSRFYVFKIKYCVSRILIITHRVI